MFQPKEDSMSQNSRASPNVTPTGETMGNVNFDLTDAGVDATIAAD